jgi:hypothetical protein
MNEETSSEHVENSVKGLCNTVSLSTPYTLDVADLTTGKYGVDGIRVVIPLDNSQSDTDDPRWKFTSKSISKQKTQYEKYYGTFSTDITSFSCYAELWDSGSKLTLGFNPSKLYTTDYCLEGTEQLETLVLLGLAALNDSVKPEWSVDYLSGEVLKPDDWREDWKSQVKISRLDAAYDFTPTNPEWAISKLVTKHPKYQANPKYYPSRTGQGTIEIQYSGSRGKVHLYDKHDKDPTAPEGLLRFEVQAKRDMLATVGLTSLDRVTDERVHELLSQRLEKSGWNSPIGISNSDLALILNSMNLSAQEKRKIHGHICMNEAGVNYGFKPRVMTEMQNTIRKLGL